MGEGFRGLGFRGIIRTSLATLGRGVRVGFVGFRALGMGCRALGFGFRVWMRARRARGA